MKKISTYLFVILCSILIFLLGFDNNITVNPNKYYRVYLDSEIIGVIESKEELEEYINSQAEGIKENVKNYNKKLDAINTYNSNETKIDGYGLDTLDKIQKLIDGKDVYSLSDIDIENLTYYKSEKLYEYSKKEISIMEDYVEENNIYLYADKVYIPNGIEIKKIYTYDSDIIEVPEIYKKIIEKKSCTISGYLFTIKSSNEGVEDLEIYTLDKDIFNDAIEKLITIFVSEDDYSLYKSESQKEISTTGSIIENIYVEEDITYKAVNISTNEKIYTDSNSLSSYLLYGDSYSEKSVTVKSGDTIESISFDNQISVQEFLIFNNKYSSRNNLLVAGTDVIISKIDPKIQIVVESYEVVDKETDYSTLEQYDENLTQGSQVITQEGEKGLERVSQNVKSVNGEITYVDPVDKQTIKSSVSRIINIGTKYIPTVGSTSSWGWPTNSGYTLSSYYGYRTAVFGEGNFHSGIDIAGTGYGSPIYAANNGVIEKMEYLYSNGNYIVINHNNGFYSMYGHMASFASGLSVGSTVARGQVIGYVGSSGWATGPHLHFEIRTCAAYSCHTNPLNFY